MGFAGGLDSKKPGEILAEGEFGQADLWKLLQWVAVIKPSLIKASPLQGGTRMMVGACASPHPGEEFYVCMQSHRRGGGLWRETVRTESVCSSLADHGVPVPREGWNCS